ncbi:flavin-nucleotide-binding protein [Bifidobacterium lemurum]|uniref:Flavin-nucleotide-binding protein n=1 Tax=Bifidobacterium lemurum TaxID=1603886 RepID=A0A261FTL5_9BIFI|nr:pyridoxamine 5'-phosphate oxidase family protein [Bifidobacterium lemurum]OZG62534.1 flavin-nucleotide-binding protein [Bifidobacterium lemurum]QOL33868.1 pyridoxamine 5'-phosphate oxidase family protein [Bifidobacterium lemurum]
MATLTAEMKTFIENNLGWVATVSKDGEVDLGPKMSMYVLDDNHIAYHERTAGQMYRNLLDGSQLVIAVANLETKTGYRFRGNVALHVDDDIYDAQVKVAEENGTKKPAVIPVLEVTEIQDLTAGANAGKTIVKD